MSDQPCWRPCGAGVDVVDLGRQLRVGMPQSPNHPQFWHTLPRRHGDMTRADGGSAANDMITHGHPRRHAHRRARPRLPGRAAARRASTPQQAGVGGKFDELGVHTIEPMVRRGVLLDVAGHLGVDRCEGGYEITVADLEATAPRPGHRRSARATSC